MPTQRIIDLSEKGDCWCRVRQGTHWVPQLSPSQLPPVGPSSLSEGYMLLGLSFVTWALTQTLVILQVLFQVLFYLCFVFPDLTLTHSNCIPVLSLGHILCFYWLCISFLLLGVRSRCLPPPCQFSACHGLFPGLERGLLCSNCV